MPRLRRWGWITARPTPEDLVADSNPVAFADNHYFPLFDRFIKQFGISNE